MSEHTKALRAYLVGHNPRDPWMAVSKLLDEIEALEAALRQVRAELQQHKEQADARHTGIQKRLDGLSGVHGAK